MFLYNLRSKICDKKRDTNRSGFLFSALRLLPPFQPSVTWHTLRREQSDRCGIENKSVSKEFVHTGFDLIGFVSQYVRSFQEEE
jgi:hypothetical protein